MKKINLIIMLLATVTMSAQQVTEITYLDVPATKIGKFAELHKTITDMSMGEERTLQGQWVYRHWYGSGPTVVVYTSYGSAADAVNNDPWAGFREAWQAGTDEEKKELESLAQKYAGYLGNHSDEIRTYNTENFVAKEDVDWDTNFVFVVGNYNTKSGDWNILGQAFMNWQTKPGVENGLQLGGGYSTHFSGTSYDVQVFQAYPTIVDFAKAISSENVADAEFAPAFWEEVSGDHNDQIYVHVGHLVDGKFDLAGPNR